MKPGLNYNDFLKYCLSLAIPVGLIGCGGGSENDESRLPKIELKAIESPVSQSIRGISVVNEQIVWMSGAEGTVLKTIDGGNNWQLLPAPDGEKLDFRSLYAFSKDEAIIASAGFPARIYRTENSGGVWKPVYEKLDSAAFINSIYFKNKKEGIAFGDVIDDRHLILLTKDGGKSWNLQDSSFLPTPLKIEHGFAASGSCITMNMKGEYVIGLGGEQSRVFIGSAGEKWHPYQTKMQSGKPTSGIYALASGGGQLMAVGGDYTLIDSAHYPTFSEDGGKTWKHTEGKVHGYRSTVDFVDKQNVWVCGGTNGLDYSMDRGINWIYHPLPGVEVNSVEFDEQSSTGWLTGAKGEIYKIIIQ